MSGLPFYYPYFECTAAVADRASTQHFSPAASSKSPAFTVSASLRLQEDRRFLMSETVWPEAQE